MEENYFIIHSTNLNIMEKEEINYKKFSKARLKSFPEKTGYVKIKNCQIVDGKPVFFVIGLDGQMKTHHGVFTKESLTEFK
jgi:hypothetical protein